MIITPLKELTMEESPDDILGPQDAATYLGKLWHRPFTSRDFNNLFTNHGDDIAMTGVKPAYKASNFTAWRRADLAIIAEKIPAPEYREKIRKPRPARKPRPNEA